MYKKLLLPIAIIAGVVSLAAMPASAKEIKNDVEYWTVSEMRDFLVEVEAEFTAACETNYRCKRDLLYERAEADGKYRALENFEREKLILAAINPVKETIKIFYQDGDKAISRRTKGASSTEDFYMLWVESWLGNPFQNGSWLTYGERYPYFLGDATTVESASHLMIDEDQERNGAGWFVPNVEREYLATGSGLNDNTVQMLYYSLLESSGGRTNGVKDYNSCFDGTDYEPGMECRYLFGADGSSRYFPFDPATATPAPTDDASSEDDVSEENSANDDRGGAESSDRTSGEAVAQTESTDSSDSLLAVTKPIIIEVEGTQSAQSSQATSPQDSAQASTAISYSTDSDTASASIVSHSNSSKGAEAPLGTHSVALPKSGDCEKEIIFPWWFIVLVAVCDIIVMWFFWPKKSEKGVDKGVSLR